MKILADRPGPVVARLIFAAILVLCLPTNAFSNDLEEANAPPEFTALNNVNAELGERMSFVVAPSDPDGDVPGVYIENKPATISFDDNLDGSRSFDWRPTQSGDFELTFVATDFRDESITTTKTIVISVAPDSNNHAPYISPLEPRQLLLGETLTVRIAPLDENGTVPGVHLKSLPANASFTDNLDGSRTFSWTPGEFDLGITLFNFIATDAQDPGLKATQTLQVSVEEKQALPQPIVAKAPSAHSIVLDASVPGSSTAATTLFNVAGQVLTIGDLAQASSVEWVNMNEAGTELDAGSFAVANDGSWQGDVFLSEGVNEISFFTNETSETSSIDVLYNRAYSFSGQLDLQPDVAYLNEPREFLARIALSDDRTLNSVVNLVSVSDGAIVATLTDDGDSSNGDDIDSDNVYSALFILNETSIGTRDLQVQVTLSNGALVNSESASLLVTEHLDSVEISGLLEQQSDLQDRIENADEGELAGEIQTILSQLQTDPDIAQAGVSDGGQGIWMVYSNGISGVLYTPKEGSKGGSTTAAVGAAAAELKVITKEQPFASSLFTVPTDGSSSDSAMVYAKSVQSIPASLELVPVKPALNSMSGIVSPTTEAPLPYSRYCSNKQSGSFRSKGAETGEDSGTQVKSTKALAIAAQYFDWGEDDDIPQMQQLLADNGCFDVTYKQYNSSGAGNVEDFKNLGEYGVILISSHGESFYSSALDSLVDQYAWEGPPGQVVLHSNMLVTNENQQTYEDDLQTGRLVLWGNHYGIMPSFISRYSGTLPDSLVYMSICKGTWNASLAQAFLGNGAETFLGYDDYVTVPFCELTGPPLLETLLNDGNTLEDAFSPGLVDPYGTDEALFKLYGSSDLEFDPSSLQDTGFEGGHVGQAWDVAGDARTLTSLGEATPTEGSQFSIISTGLSSPINTGSITQRFCLCEAASTITFDWNFFSEEFPQAVGTDYQDSFTAVIVDIDDPNNEYAMISENINSLANSVEPAANAFDRGDVHATGWRHFSGNIPAALRGKKIQLKFETMDVGDSNFDTAVLIDNINLACSQN